MTATNKLIVLLSAGLLLTLLGGCSSMPNYKYMEEGNKIAATDVSYSIDPTASFGGIECLAIMPLKISPRAAKPLEISNLIPQAQLSTVTPDVLPEEIYAHHLDATGKQQMVRNMLFAYVAPYEIRDIDLSEIDRHVSMEGHPKQGQRSNYRKLSRLLDCDWFLEGTITRFDTNFYGVYSNIVVAAELKIILAEDGSVIWEGHHEARSDGGALPLSPVDLAMGAVKAVSLINPDQLERTVSDVARRLTRTMPLEDDNTFLFAARRKQMLEVVASSLNLRQGPGRDFAINHVLKNREQVAVLDVDKDKSWFLVQTADGFRGYASARYLN